MGILLGIVGLVLLVAAGDYLWVRYNGTAVPRPSIPRGIQTVGQTGPVLTFAVLGDSTSIGQGGDYQRGYAVAAAEYLGRTHRVSWLNVGVSGARARDVRAEQLPKVLLHKPEVVLIAVGANDVTHLSRPGAVRTSLAQTIQALQQANSDVRIVLTGSPDMGAPPRLPQPLRWMAGARTRTINKQIRSLADGSRVVFAPIAERTGPAFRAHPDLFAADHFHPSSAGYDLWTPVIQAALEQLRLP